jgi:hypothetical protein
VTGVIRRLLVGGDGERVREGLGHQPVAELQKVGLRGRQRQVDAVGDAESGVPALGVHLVDGVVDPGLAAQRVVELGVDGDAEPVLTGDLPTVLAGAVDEDLLGPSTSSPTCTRPPGSLLEAPLLQRGADRR